MIAIDLGNYQRNARRLTISRCIRANGITGSSETRFDFFGVRRRQSGKNEFGGQIGRRMADDEIARRFRWIAIQHPAGFAVSLADAALRTSQSDNFKPGMFGEQLHKTLANGAGRAQHSHGDFFRKVGFHSIYHYFSPRYPKGYRRHEAHKNYFVFSVSPW